MWRRRLHERKMARRAAAAEAELVGLRAQYHDDVSVKKGAPAETGRRADIRVEVPGQGEAPAPCAPKLSPALSPGKAPPPAAAPDV